MLVNRQGCCWRVLEPLQAAGKLQAAAADPVPEHLQGQHAAAYLQGEHLAGAHDSSSAGAQQAAATRQPAVLTAAEERTTGEAATGQVLERTPSSSSSSPSSVAKPLLAAFTAAAGQPAGQPDSQLLQQAQQQQQQQQQLEQGSGSEVTLRSLPDSPGRRRQRQRQPQQQQVPLQHAPLPGSPPRPLLGAWAARAAAASSAPSSPSQPRGPAAAQYIAGPPVGASKTDAGAGSSFEAVEAAGAAVAGLGNVAGIASGALPSGVIVTEAVPGDGMKTVEAASGNAGASIAGGMLQAAQEPADEQQQAPPAAGLAEAMGDKSVQQQLLPLSQHSQQQQLQQQQQPQQPWQQQVGVQLSMGSSGADVAWPHLSARLSAAGFGHLTLLPQQEKGAAATAAAAGGVLQLQEQQQLVPDLQSLYDSFDKVCVCPPCSYRQSMWLAVSWGCVCSVKGLHLVGCCTG